jgi:hypothetical protein
MGLLIYNDKIMKDKYTNKLLDDLVSYWTLDNVSIATDLHGNDNGTINGCTDRQGKIDRCYNFDGIDDYINIPSSTNNNIGLSDFAFSFWIYPDLLAKSGDDHTYIVSNSYNFTNTFLLFYKPNPGYLSIVEYKTSVNEFLTSIPLSINMWTHLIFQRNNGYWQIYKNGSLDYNNQTTINTTFRNSDIQFGYAVPRNNGPAHLNGAMDEICFWKRALTTDEAELLYNNGNGLRYNKFK